MSMKIKRKAADSPPRLPSEYNFGLFFTGFFILTGCYVLYMAYPKMLAVALVVVGVLFFIVTMLSPRLLVPLNRAWYALGVLLGKIVNPLVLGVVFFIVITPTAMVIKLAGRDALRLHKKSLDSYWIDRSPAGPDSQSFKNQF